MRHEIAVIMRDSLLCLITQAASDSPTLSQIFHNVFSGNSSDIKTATIRVPAFSDINQLKSPEYGYRQLGNISNHFSFQLQAVPPTLDQQNEVFAADPEHLKSQDYCRIWQMYGLKMDRHFILIFHLPHNHHPASLSSSPASRNSPFGSLSPHSEHSASLVSFLQQVDSQPVLPHSRISSPVQNFMPISSKHKFLLSIT